jgi:hypothetical protein
MRKIAALLLATGLMLPHYPAYSQQYQDCVDVRIDKTYVKTSGSSNLLAPAAIVTVTNNCQTFLKGILINCVWLNGDKAIATEKAPFQNMPPGAKDSLDFWANRTSDSFDSIRCRVNMAY